jgi:predicted AlkP superfamily pyrophosphatase or phosphodiesterase
MAEQAAISLKKSPSFTYVYVNDVDVAGHSDGVGSDKWLGALSYVDRVLATLIERLPGGTRIWITADHGMVNAKEKIVLGRENSLLEGISLVAGEPRARHLYLDDDHLSGAGPDEASIRYREFFGDRIDVYTRAEAIESELFGKVVTEASHDRMGDVIAVPHDAIVLIDPLRVDLESSMVGHHGAMTDAERFVPLRTVSIN